jgi:alanyl-tRNA synthetase
MQFNRDEQGVLHKLPKQSVDTGMGMERLAAVLQHVHSNYEIDLFQALIKAAARETGATDLENKSLRVIADHIRSAAFMIVDGVIPGSEGRAYVLRRIIRRALRHGHKLGQTKPFFYKLVADLAIEMGSAYPELEEAKENVAKMLKAEEERFGETLETGMKVLEAQLAKDATRIDGATAFTLYETYGFPPDLTADICRERNIGFDQEGYDAALKESQELSRKGGKSVKDAKVEYTGEKNKFVGYDSLSHATAKVIALYAAGSPVQELKAGQSGIVVLDTTPFYAESGGQVGDQGVIATASAQFDVSDTLKVQADVYGHHGVLASGSLKVGDAVSATVDEAKRGRTIRNHSATHLMHKALREVLGSHVAQKGSLVDPDKARFDFSHNAPMTAAEIAQVEAIVNREILANAPVQSHHMSFDDAVKHGAMALFGEKYGDEVRVMDIGTSKELCGGVHVNRTGDIGLFKIVSEGGVAAGIRRVEAVTGEGALALVQGMARKLGEAAAALKSNPDELTTKIVAVQDQVKSLEKELAALKSKLASGQGDELAGQAVDVKGIKVLAATLDGADVTALRETMDKLKDKLKTAAIVLAAVNDGKVSLIAGVTADSTSKVKAGELVNFVAQQVGGKGGGRPDMAQAGGTDPSGLAGALAGVSAWVGERV